MKANDWKAIGCILLAIAVGVLISAIMVGNWSLIPSGRNMPAASLVVIGGAFIISAGLAFVRASELDSDEE